MTTTTQSTKVNQERTKVLPKKDFAVLQIPTVEGTSNFFTKEGVTIEVSNHFVLMSDSRDEHRRQLKINIEPGTEKIFATRTYRSDNEIQFYPTILKPSHKLYKYKELLLKYGFIDGVKNRCNRSGFNGVKKSIEDVDPTEFETKLVTTKYFAFSFVRELAEKATFKPLSYYHNTNADISKMTRVLEEVLNSTSENAFSGDTSDVKPNVYSINNTSTETEYDEVLELDDDQYDVICKLGFAGNDFDLFIEGGVEEVKNHANLIDSAYDIIIVDNDSGDPDKKFSFSLARKATEKRFVPLSYYCTNKANFEEIKGQVSYILNNVSGKRENNLKNEVDHPNDIPKNSETINVA